jgi:hypothetical protein
VRTRFPGLRFAPTWAIIVPSLREEADRQACTNSRKKHFRQQKEFMRFPWESNLLQATPCRPMIRSLEPETQSGGLLPGSCFSLPNDDLTPRSETAGNNFSRSCQSGAEFAVHPSGLYTLM